MRKFKKQKNQMITAFGIDEYDQTTVPLKISGRTVARLLMGASSGCGFCFPHGHGTSNAWWRKDLKCWKRYRKKQYRVVSKKYNDDIVAY